MSGRERFLAALLRGERPRPAPLAHVAALTTVRLQAATGCWMPAVHHDADQQARLMAANHQVLGFDAVSVLINYFTEPAALGAQLDWGSPERLPMYVSHPWRTPEDAGAPPDLLDRPPLRTALETIRLARRRLEGRAAVLGKVMGPLSLTQAMHGVEPTMLLTLDDPPQLDAFLEAAVGVLVRSANAQREAGAEAISIGEGGAGAKMLSPQAYQQLLAPWHRRLIAAIDGPVILHMCGDMRPRAALLGQLGLDCFNFDWAVPPADMVRLAAGRYSLMGNINTTDLLVGSPRQIRRQVGACLEAGVPIISPGCAISPKCPLENLLAMRQAIDQWPGPR